jgi:hypothetical protein
MHIRALLDTMEVLSRFFKVFLLDEECMLSAAGTMILAAPCPTTLCGAYRTA